VLRRIFEPKTDEVTGGWRKLYNEELRNLYSLSDITEIKLRRIRGVGHVASMGEMRTAYKMSVGKFEGKRSFGRHRHR
jgi:hypothetical protein